MSGMINKENSMVYLKSIDAMVLNHLQITDVQFDKGVTAIVGPNGSGKVISLMPLNGY